MLTSSGQQLTLISIEKKNIDILGLKKDLLSENIPYAMNTTSP